MSQKIANGQKIVSNSTSSSIVVDVLDLNPDQESLFFRSFSADQGASRNGKNTVAWTWTLKRMEDRIISLQRFLKYLQQNMVTSENINRMQDQMQGQREKMQGELTQTFGQHIKALKQSNQQTYAALQHRIDILTQGCMLLAITITAYNAFQAKDTPTCPPQPTTTPIEADNEAMEASS